MIALRLGAVCCAQRLGWTTVHCIRAGQMRAVEDIHGEIMGILG